MTDPYRRGSVYVTYQCNLHCPLCGVQPKRAAQPNYMMTRAGFERIVGRLMYLNWPLKTFSFTGGEPTLWPDLPWAIGHVKRIAGYVKVLTNGINAAPEMFAGADEVQIGNYGEANRYAIWHLVRALKRKCRVSIANSHQIPLSRCAEVEGRIPARCNLLGLYFIGDQVCPCQMGDVRASLDEDFLGLFRSAEPRTREVCRHCLGNGDVKRQAGIPAALEVGVWNSNYVTTMSLGWSYRALKPMLARLRAW